MEIRTFNRTDFAAWAGAACFTDGQEPLIAEWADRYTMVAGGESVELYDTELGVYYQSPQEMRSSTVARDMMEAIGALATYFGGNVARAAIAMGWTADEYV